MYARFLVALVAVFVAGAGLAQSLSTSAVDEPDSGAIANTQLNGTRLSLVTRIGYELATLRVAGPDGYELTKEFAGVPVSVDLVVDQSEPTEPSSTPMSAAEAAIGLRDGRYAYHVSFRLANGGKRSHAGSFEVSNGSASALSLPRADVDGLESSVSGASSESGTEATEPNFVTISDSAQDGETFLQLDSFPSGANFKAWIFRNDDGLMRVQSVDGFTSPVDVMSLEITGDVGIGTTAPAADFEVVGNGGNVRMIDDDQPFFGSGWELNDEGRLRVVALGNPGTASFYPEGGLFVGTSAGPVSPSAMLHVEGSGIIEGDVSLGSSRTIKHEIEPLDESGVLSKLRRLPIYEWKYRNDEAQATHTGPMAEDMYEAFRIGRDNRHLSPADSAGLALAAIKGVDSRLDQEVEELRGLNAALVAESEALWERLRVLEELLRSAGEH